MDKEKRKEILKQVAQEELIKFRKNLPIDENIFPKLFDFLDIELENHGCNHTSTLTKTFLQKIGVLNIIEVTEWLADNGGYCDCEILANVEDLFDYLNQKQINPIPKKDIRKQKTNSLKTDFGFSIEEIPSPWNLIEIISKNSKEYQFQIGKNNICKVSLQTDYSLFQSDNDELWKNLWINETELKHNLDDITIERIQLGNYLVIIAKTKNWTPVKIWCNKENTKWLLKMNTELSRHKGDIKELEKLLNNIF